MGSSLIIDDKVQSDIKRVVDYAVSNPFDTDDMLDLINGAITPAGDRKEYCVFIPSKYKVVFSIEKQPKFWAKHISISCDDKMPNPLSAQIIIQAFGFKKNLEDCYVYEDVDCIAINILEEHEVA